MTKRKSTVGTATPQKVKNEAMETDGTPAKSGPKTPKSARKVNVQIDTPEKTPVTPKSAKKGKKQVVEEESSMEVGEGYISLGQDSPKKSKRKGKKRKSNEATVEKENGDENSNASDNDEEAEPEKKKRRKRRNRPVGDPVVKNKAALKYLQTWNDDKDSWKFNKKWQKYLLNNLFDSEKVPEANFDVLLKYLTPLKGSSRPGTVAFAARMLEKELKNDKQDKSIVQRCEKVIKLLK